MRLYAASLPAALLLAGCNTAVEEPSAAAADPPRAEEMRDVSVPDAPEPAGTVAEPEMPAAGEPELTFADELKPIVAALPKSAPPQLRESLAQWPAEGPAAAAEMAAVLSAAAQSVLKTDKDAGYEAFRLAGEAAEKAVADVDATGYPPERFGGMFYNQACALALQGQTDDAVAALKRAVEYGFDDLELIENDPDLSELRGTEEFDTMLAEAKKIAAERIREEAMRTLAEGEAFPLEFTYTAIDGAEHSLDDYKGKVVVVDFWGTWCPPCRAEIPSFVALQERYGEDGLQILGLNYRDTEEKVADFAEEYGINYPTGLGDPETRDMVPNFRGYPTTVFVGRDGTVRATVVGAHPEAFLETIVTELLAEEA